MTGALVGIRAGRSAADATPKGKAAVATPAKKKPLILMGYPTASERVARIYPQSFHPYVTFISQNQSFKHQIQTANHDECVSCPKARPNRTDGPLTRSTSISNEQLRKRK